MTVQSPSPLLHRITVRKPGSEDVLRLSVLFQQVYIQTYGTEGITHEFANFVTRRFSSETVAFTLAKETDSYLVAYVNDNPVGVAEIVYDGTCKIGNARAPELSKLYVLERFCGKGIGALLLHETETLLRTKGYDSLWLEVYAENPRAVAFYRRQGFQCIGTVPFVMEHNTYVNYVMFKQFLNA